MEHTELALLISRSREGDAAAIEALVYHHDASIRRLALSILDDPDEADEAAHEAFVIAIDRLSSFRGEASFSTWLYAIALNVCRGRLRKRRVRDRLIEIIRSLLRANRDEADQPEQVVIQREVRTAVWGAIRQLDDKQREVIVLRYFHELRLDDIAQIAGVSERTVRNRLHAAHERLRTSLKGQIDSR